MSKMGRGAKTITEDQLRDEWAALSGPPRIPSAGKTIKQLAADWGMTEPQVRGRVQKLIAQGKLRVLGRRPTGLDVVYDLVRQ